MQDYLTIRYTGGGGGSHLENKNSSTSFTLSICSIWEISFKTSQQQIEAHIVYKSFEHDF